MDASSSDPRYRRYMSSIEKILQTFDTMREWPDVIQFLSQLNKAISTNPYKKIPFFVTLTKRLAQCLNPALPSGVHSKALDVYLLIIKTIGLEGVQQNLELFYGLFPVLHYANMSIKPQLLSVYEEFLPLENALKPCLKAFIIALLSGLEELPDRTMAIFKRIKVEGFMDRLYEVLIKAPSMRLYAITLLSQLEQDDSASHELLVGAICCCLSDANILVQRQVLDLLITRYPINKHKLDVMESALCVVLRKDMSLNRRLYSWLMGPDDGDKDVYFKEHSLTECTGTLARMFYQKQDSVSEFSRPYKVMISLMDKSEIGLPIVGRIFDAILDSLFQHKSTELIHTANMFLDILEPLFVWSHVYRLIDTKLELVEFVIREMRIRDEETITVHFSLLFLLIVEKRVDSRDARLISIAELLLERVSEHVFKAGDETIDLQKAKKLYLMELDQAYESDFYQKCEETVKQAFLLQSRKLLEEIIVSLLKEEEDFGQVKRILKIYREINLRDRIGIEKQLKSPKSPVRRKFSFGGVDKWYHQVLRLSVQAKVNIETIFEILELVYSLIESAQLPQSIIDFHSQILLLWENIENSKALELMWFLYKFDYIKVETIVYQLLKQKKDYERFSLFYRKSNPSGIQFSESLFLVVSLLQSNDPAEKRTAELFLKLSMKSFTKLLEPILVCLLDPTMITENQLTIDAECLNLAQIDIKKYQQLLQILIQVLRYGGDKMISSLTAQSLSLDLVKLMNLKHFDCKNYYELVLVSCLDLLLIRNMPVKLKQLCAELLVLLLMQLKSADSNELLKQMFQLIIKKLEYVIQAGELDLQCSLISLLHLLVQSLPKQSMENLFDLFHKSLTTPSNYDLLPYYFELLLGSLKSFNIDFIHSMIDLLSENLKNEVIVQQVVGALEKLVIYANKQQSNQPADELMRLSEFIFATTPQKNELIPLIRKIIVNLHSVNSEKLNKLVDTLYRLFSNEFVMEVITNEKITEKTRLLNLVKDYSPKVIVEKVLSLVSDLKKSPIISQLIEFLALVAKERDTIQAILNSLLIKDQSHVKLFAYPTLRLLKDAQDGFTLPEFSDAFVKILSQSILTTSRLLEQLFKKFSSQDSNEAQAHISTYQDTIDMLSEAQLHSITTDLVYYVVQPILKQQKIHDKFLLFHAFKLLKLFSKYPYLLKHWKSCFYDYFIDFKFFSNLQALNEIEGFFQLTLDLTAAVGKDKFDDLLGRIVTTPVGLFTSKEQEYLIRSYQLRKLSFVLFASDIDEFYPQLTLIDEKLVEILKQPYNIVHAEAYLCMRVLFLKMSTKHLFNFWPKILTELMRLFSVKDLSREFLMVLLAACKFIDFVLLLDCEEVQIYDFILKDMILKCANLEQEKEVEQERLFIEDLHHDISNIDQLAPYFGTLLKRETRVTKYNSYPNEVASTSSTLPSRINVAMVMNAIASDFMHVSM